ncbi:phosphatase PAP2 family protein [Metabacillus sp. GX 13764]|uniref:phosphatase PAP2 family protein n=1 Tax=Metabacillus kandeliae TaxID=2900151 RepID=UPI001E41FE9B|nr:phosphatase PAP2 family protein [Metabacillus kandeliae]MCD7033496.1 phosphatase PAP2 family protein [Metabacillus kandeliae]
MKWFLSCLMIFAYLGYTADSGVSWQLDKFIALKLEEIRFPFLTETMMAITELGSFRWTLPLMLVFLLWLCCRKKWIPSLFLIFSFFSVRLFNTILKGLYERDRPSFNPLADEESYSYPSGHAMNSTVFYGYLCYILIEEFPFIKSRKKCFYIVTAVLICIIGFSRLYLGVHYLTDIAGGITAGAAWLIIIFKIIQSTKIEEKR